MALFGLTRSVSPEPLVRGDGIYLRPATPADYASWSRLRAASRAFLEPWEPTWPEDDLTQAAFRRRLRRQDEDIARDEAYAFLIFDQTSDQLLGGITLGGVRRGVSQTGTLGYWMGAPHAGKGRMTRAVAAIVDFAFSKLRLHRVEAACIPDNAPSIALLERNGFQREGYARGYLKIDGAWRDHVLFALVEGDARATDGVLIWLRSNCTPAEPFSRRSLGATVGGGTLRLLLRLVFLLAFVFAGARRPSRFNRSGCRPTPTRSTSPAPSNVTAPKAIGSRSRPRPAPTGLCGASR